MYISKKFGYNNKRIHLKCKSDASKIFGLAPDSTIVD